ncbi:hypothetical protein [Nocardia gipuzkoensis]
MGHELPHEVAVFLNLIGVPYPDIDADQVRELARQVELFTQSVRDTHEASTGAIQDMGAVYSGDSYEQLLASWAHMSSTHMVAMDRACRFLVKALEMTADVIEITQDAVLVGLAATAASYMGLMAATVVSGGVSAAMTAAVRVATKRILDAMEEMLVAYIAAEVIERAIEPLEQTIERMINGTVDAADLLHVSAPGGAAAPALYIEPDEVLRYANLLDTYADQILEHAATFARNVAGLDFTAPGRADDTNARTGMLDSARDGERSSNAPPRAAQPHPEVDGVAPLAPARALVAPNESFDDSQLLSASQIPAGEAGPSTADASESGGTPSGTETVGAAQNDPRYSVRAQPESPGLSQSTATTSTPNLENHSYSAVTESTSYASSPTKSDPYWHIVTNQTEGTAQQRDSSQPASSPTGSSEYRPPVDKWVPLADHSTSPQPKSAPQDRSTSTPWGHPKPQSQRTTAAVTPSVNGAGRKHLAGPLENGSRVQTPWSRKPPGHRTTAERTVFAPEVATPPQLHADRHADSRPDTETSAAPLSSANNADDGDLASKANQQTSRKDAKPAEPESRQPPRRSTSTP